ncbi:MAG TPA: hypothetical protein PLZ43_15675 [bacterium]|nr:hypothetical protein [bacterium]
MYSRNIIIAIAALLAVFILVSCGGDTDFKGLYTPPKPPEAGDTRMKDCPDKPEPGTEWNTISEYQQTWDGYAWQPADVTATVYSETPSTTTCQFKCALQYLWNGSYCALDTQNTYKVYKCSPKPEGEGYEWNTVSEYNQMSSDQGVNYYPADDSTTEYSDYPSTTSCQYKCSTGYTWNGTICVKDGTGRTFNCNPLPDESGVYVWNTVSSYSQESSDGGSTWYPADDPTTEYNETPGSTSCQFKCYDGYGWDGTKCFAWQDTAGYYWYKPDAQFTYSEAAAYCSSIGGTVPSVDMLRLLIINCTDTVTSGACGVNSSCTTWATCRTASCESCSDQSYGYYSVFGDSSWFWTSTQVTDQTDSVFTVNFNTGGINMSAMSATGGTVRCLKNQ